MPKQTIRQLISMKVHTKDFTDDLKQRVNAVPALGRKAMGSAVAWWHAQAAKRVPVSAGPGRGQLRKRLQAYTHVSGTSIHGGLLIGTHYGVYLTLGTERIAKGAVKRWKAGDPMITSWPAKSAGGSPQGAMPVALPWYLEARDRLADAVMEGL